MNEKIFIYDDEFSKAEQIGRSIWYDFITNENILQDITFTPTKFDKVDGVMTLKTYDKPITFEIKRRNINSEQYKKEGYIIEKIKYDALSVVDGYGWYINIFDDCIKIWDITTLAPHFEWKYCTATTAINYKKGEKPKLVHLIKENEKPIYIIN